MKRTTVHASDEDRDDRRSRSDADEAVYAVDSSGEVRAGPGDAGATRKAKKPRGGRKLFIALLIAGPLAMLLFWLLFG